MSTKVSGWPLVRPVEIDTSITGDQVLAALDADLQASDEGKALTVEKDVASKAAFIPSQSVVISGGNNAELENVVNADLYVNGALVSLTIDDVMYTGAVNNGEVVFAGDPDSADFLCLEIYDNVFYLNVGTDGTYTVSAVFAEYQYSAQWAELPDPLPTIAAGDAGKVLTVNVGETGAEWAAAGGGINYMMIPPTGDPYTSVAVGHSSLKISFEIAALASKTIYAIIPFTPKTSSDNNAPVLVSLQGASKYGTGTPSLPVEVVSNGRFQIHVSVYNPGSSALSVKFAFIVLYL